MIERDVEVESKGARLTGTLCLPAAAGEFTVVEDELARSKGVGRLVYLLAAAIFGSPRATQQKLLEKIDRSTEPSMRVGFQRVPAKWLRELLSVDVEKVFRQVACPLLLVGGEKDLQCDPGDVAKIAALAQSSVEQHVVPDLTHLLRRDALAPTLLGASRLLKSPVEPAVLDIVANWLQARSI